MKGVNIFLADGFEDCEALATNDVLRRGGVDSRLVSIGCGLEVKSSHGVTVRADCLLDDSGVGCHCGTTASDVMIFPGGMPGSRNLAGCEPLIKAMQYHYDAGGTLAAICAAPGLVLGRLEGLAGVEFTCFDGFQDGPVSEGAIFREAPAVRCGRIITGRSAGHSVSFALEILRALKGEEKVAEVRHALYLL